jgi:hypothetical protein
MTKTPEPQSLNRPSLSELPIIKNRHYAQSSTSAARKEQRIERRRRGEAGFPKRRWKKGSGGRFRWSPFAEFGPSLAEQGFQEIGTLFDEGKNS